MSCRLPSLAEASETPDVFSSVVSAEQTSKVVDCNQRSVERLEHNSRTSRWCPLEGPEKARPSRDDASGREKVDPLGICPLTPEPPPVFNVVLRGPFGGWSGGHQLTTPSHPPKPPASDRQSGCLNALVRCAFKRCKCLLQNWLLTQERAPVILPSALASRMTR